MKRKLIQSIATAVVISAISLPSQAFSLFGFGSKKNSVESMIEYIPASTPLFIGSVSTKDMVSGGDALLDTIDMEVVGQEVASLMYEIGDEPTSEFLQLLIKDYYNNAANGGLAVYDAYGFDPKGASVIYMSGLYPVIRISLSDDSAFLDSLKESAVQAGFKLSDKVVQDNVITSMTLDNKNDATIAFGLLVKDSVLTISAYSVYDDEADIAERFAIQKPANTLDPKDWDKDGKAYGFDKSSRGYVSFLNIVKSVFDQSSLAHTQALEFMQTPYSPVEMFFAEQCHAEIESLVAGMPRLVFGTQKYKIDDSSVDVDLSYTLELKSEYVLDQLTMLQGFLPEFITEDSDLTAGLALGLNLDKVAPVLTELWTTFISADYECDVLIEAQEELKSVNPGILAMASGMVQGFKGASIGLYDVVEDESSMLGRSIDAIATVSTESPELLLSLVTSYVPFFQGLDIATDGTPTSLDSIDLPITGVNIAVKGDHIVLYTGEKSEKTAQTLEKEALDTSGLMAFNINYQNLSDLMINASGALGLYEMTYGSSESCQDLYTSALLLSQIPLSLNGIESITENGLTSAWSLNMDMSNLVNGNEELAGDYELAYLDYDCSWLPIGTEVIAEEGEGVYYEQDESMSCNVSEASYTWERYGNYMYQTGTSTKYRDSCDEDWDDYDAYDFECKIMSATEEGFYCIEDDGYDATMYRYLRK